MPVDLNATKYAEQNGRIDYPSGNSILWGPHQTNIGTVFTYQTSRSTIHLNDLLPIGWIFEAVNNKFRAYISSTYGYLPDYPEVHASIPELKKNECEILGLLHEIGHAWDMTRLRQEIPDINHKAEDKPHFTETYPFVHKKIFTCHINNEWHSLYEGAFGTTRQGEIVSERNAWAIALRLKRWLNILPELKGTDLREFYNKGLTSHYERALSGTRNTFRHYLSCKRIKPS
ncbi:hypothetical protein HY485_05250 [Candidatus Woesearchaeota archaeon]|nr:hypothetical protein [Candidatus Woesearchaeota archaeon]